MKTIRTLLQERPNPIWTVAPNTSVYDALHLMADKDVGALLVVADNRMIGIMTERDYARKIALHDRASRDTTVQDIMTSNVCTAHPDQPIEECMRTMDEYHVRHLPILDGETILGLISIRDVIREVIADQAFMIGQLENYITGGQGI